SRLRQTWDWPGRFLAFGLVLSATASGLVLALSAVAKSGRYAAVYFAILFFLSTPVSWILSRITGERSVRALGLSPALNSVGKELFGLFPRANEAPFAASLVVILGAVAVSAAVTWRRTRPSEVVK
ncbi:MAG: hypothetical protein ACREIU_03130, partial [Planctomycetota bacterium]